jgi:hypothetical protein
MHLRYGFNLGERWRDLMLSPAREALLARLQAARTDQVRVFLKVDDRLEAEESAVATLLDVLAQAGVTPMVAWAQPSGWRLPGAIRQFARDAAAFVARACERWGVETVGSWYWSLGDEPNSPWTNDGFTFDAYCDLYQTTADAIRNHLGSRTTRPRVGGPCIDGFQPFWFDWIWRFVEQVDNSLIGFVAWNRYGEWREPGAWAAPHDPTLFRRLLLSRTAEYWTRAAAIHTVLEGRGILNICSELNAHSHSEPAVSAPLNQGWLGAVYYASALLELMRGGADGEFLWAGAGAAGPYSALDPTGAATPTYFAKRIVAEHVRFGDRLAFPVDMDPEPALDAVVAMSPDGRRSALLVHREDIPRSIDLARWPALGGFREVTVLAGPQTASEALCPSDGVLTMEGYGLAVLR